MTPLYALSVRQPWAWAIIVLGKDVENRSWRTRHRGPLLIHASRLVDAKTVEEFTKHVEARPELAERLAAAGGLDLDALRAQAGGIVGQVDVLDCVARSDSPWFAGPFGLVLANPTPLPFRPCRGQLNLFQPLDDAERAAVKAARATPAAAPDLFA